MVYDSMEQTGHSSEVSNWSDTVVRSEIRPVDAITKNSLWAPRLGTGRPQVSFILLGASLALIASVDNLSYDESAVS
jgi:hypothetical protein